MRLCRFDGAIRPGLRQDADPFPAARHGAEGAGMVRGRENDPAAGPRLLPARAALSAPHRNLACHRRGRAVPALRRLCRDETARLPALAALRRLGQPRSEEHTSELQSLMRISYAVFCLKKQKNINTKIPT